MSKDGRIFIWADAAQQALIADAVRAGGLTVAAIGAERAADASDLAAAFDAPRVTDLRQGAQRSDIDLVWLAAAEPIERDALDVIRQVGRPAVTSHPRPGAAPDLISDPHGYDFLRFVPLMRSGAAWRAATDVLAEFGEVQSAYIALRCGAADGTLLARLYDAMDLLHAVCGEAETMFAALASPGGRVPEALDGLTGHLALTLRFADHRCAGAAVTDRAGRWFRGVTLLGDGGCLRLDDCGFEWLAPEGTVLDQTRAADTATAGELTGLQIRSVLEHREVAEPPAGAAERLALCEAARLSCRTGQVEAPRKMLEMLRRP